MTERTPYEVASLVYLTHVNDCPVCEEKPDPPMWDGFGWLPGNSRFTYCRAGRQFRDEVVRTELLMNLSKEAL